MEILRAVILGFVQGVAEFLPISSKGHLVIVRTLLDQVLGTGGAPDKGEALAETVLLHLGTLIAILIVYREAIWKLRLQPRVCLNVVIASIPAAVLGLLFKEHFEKLFTSPLYAGVGLFVTAGMLLIGQRLERNEFSYEDLPFGKSLMIGLFQAFALMPGISRSGSTITGGLVTGMQRSSAGLFSFLMAVPVTAGAVLLAVKDLAKGDVTVRAPVPLLIGTVTSFVVGWIALRWLVQFIARGRLHWFAYYCVAAGTLTVVWQLFDAVGQVKVAGP